MVGILLNSLNAGVGCRKDRRRSNLSERIHQARDPPAIELLRRHVAVEQIDVAHKTGIEERCLVRGGVAAADQRAPARSTVFLELFAQCLEGLSWQRNQGCPEYCA